MAYAVTNQGVLLKGFSELSRALRDLEGGSGNFGIAYELQARLRRIGEKVAVTAPGFVTHRTGRHGEGVRLEDSVKVSVTARSASVYSSSVYGGVQNVGGGPHAGWAARGPHVQKGNASGWMNRAVDVNKAWVEQETEGLVDWVIREFERGA